MSELPDPVRCRNCGAELPGEYCGICGQRKQDPTHLSLREFIHEIIEELAHWDGKIPQTVKALLTKPGFLTKEFFAGRRARWIPPLRLYLVCSLLYFLSLPTAELISHRAARETAKITVTDSTGKATLDSASLSQIEQTAIGRFFGRERIIKAVQNGAQLNDELAKNQPKAMFVLLPLFALFTSLLWRRRHLRYPAHLYFALHLHSAWFGALALCVMLGAFGPDWWAESWGAAGLLFLLWYGVSALRNVFGDSWAKTIAKALVVGVLYSGAYFLVTLALMAYALANM